MTTQRQPKRNKVCPSICMNIDFRSIPTFSVKICIYVCTAMRKNCLIDFWTIKSNPTKKKGNFTSYMSFYPCIRQAPSYLQEVSLSKWLCFQRININNLSHDYSMHAHLSCKFQVHWESKSNLIFWKEKLQDWMKNIKSCFFLHAIFWNSLAEYLFDKSESTNLLSSMNIDGKHCRLCLWIGEPLSLWKVLSNGESYNWNHMMVAWRVVFGFLSVEKIPYRSVWKHFIEREIRSYLTKFIKNVNLTYDFIFLYRFKNFIEK